MADRAPDFDEADLMREALGQQAPEKELEVEPFVSNKFEVLKAQEGQVGCQLNKLFFQLKQLIHNEKFSPEILPYSGNIVSRVQNLIGVQEQELSNIKEKNQDARFRASMLRMEVERAKYMFKDYLRARLLKIEK